MNRLSTFWDDIWRDKTGKPVILQLPNAPLVGWGIFMVAGWFLPDGGWGVAVQYLSFGFLFTWAWLELYSGRSYIRRLLGLAVLIMIIYNRAVR